MLLFLIFSFCFSFQEQFMNHFFKYYFSIIFITILFFYIIIFILSSAILSTNDSEEKIDNPEVSNFYFDGNFFWPVPGFHRITSPFGPRKSPTSGSSSNHSGVDIAAPEGTFIYSAISGIVSFVGFKGAGGCTITTIADNISVSYCHVSPNYVVSVGQVINIGEHIGNVGPKILHGIPNNPYKDSSRKSNKWSHNRLSSSSNNT